MKATDKAEFAKVVLAFAELKGKQLSLPAVELYWAAMQDWELEDFKAAAMQLLKTAEFMPTPKDFEDLRRAGRMTSGEAFAKALDWAKTGGYRNPARTPEAILIDRVVNAMGGWYAITGADPDTIHWVEKRFAEHYADICDASDTRKALPRLTQSETIAVDIRKYIADPLRAVKRVTGPLDAVGRDPAPYGKVLA